MAAQKGRNAVGAHEAKTHWPKLLERVEAGEEITILKRGAPLAKLVPIRKQEGAEECAAAIRRIQTLAAGLPLGSLKVKDMIREHRR